jgi:hypothetical protein
MRKNSDGDFRGSQIVDDRDGSAMPMIPSSVISLIGRWCQSMAAFYLDVVIPFVD